MPDVDSTVTAGVEARGYRRGAAATDGWDQYVVPVRDRVVAFDGRATSFLINGNAATTVQPLIAINNLAASPVLVAVNRIKVDVVQLSAAVAITVAPPVIRLVRVSTASTGGTLLTKGSQDTALTSSASVEVRGGSSADAGTITAITLGTRVATLSQTMGPRIVQGTATAANSVVAELIDTATFLYGEPDVILRPGEGLAVILEAQAALGNPATNKWTAQLDWEEYTRP